MIVVAIYCAAFIVAGVLLKIFAVCWEDLEYYFLDLRRATLGSDLNKL